MSSALQHHPYATPPVIPDCYVTCLVRGVVWLVGLTSGAIPWPVGEKGGVEALVVYRGLARALQTESVEAVAASWGESVAMVKAWQAAIGEPAKPHVHDSKSQKPPWTTEEIESILATDDIVAFAKEHGRTVAACKHQVWLMRRGRVRTLR